MGDDRFSFSGKLDLLFAIARDPRLQRSAIAVATVLIDHANRDTGACYPSLTTIVRDSGVPKTTAIRGLKSLEDRGWVSIEKRNGAASNYHLQTGATLGTGSAAGTGAIQNLRRGRTGATYGTEAVPQPGPEKREKLKSNRKRVRIPETTFIEFITTCHRAGEKPIPPGDPIFKFADDAGIPRDFLHLAWRWFSDRYRDDHKTYRDWRAVFRRAIREDWHHCWRLDQGTGQLVLTTAGLQLQRQAEAEQQRREAA